MEGLVHIGMIQIISMALTSKIVATSHMEHIRIHKNLVLRYSLRRRNPVTIVIGLID